MGLVTALIDEANVRRLAEWKSYMRTRSGAAKWTLTRMLNRIAAVLPIFGNVAFCPDGLAQQLAIGFA